MATDDDKELFRRAMAQTGVVRQRYKSAGMVNNTPLRPGPVRNQQRRVDSSAGFPEQWPLPLPIAAAIDRTDGDHNIQFVRTAVDKMRWKQLRKGAITVEESIDLHGMRSHQASQALQQFIAECINYKLQCVEIIHGKGQGSEQPGGVLRPLTFHFLKRQPEVTAFCSAPASQGGSGATLVLLKPLP